MQGSRSGAGVCFRVRLLVARCLRKWRRQGRPTTACTTKTVRSLRLCSLGSQISFVPNLRAYRGMLGRACCRLPTATLRCVVGRRALACAPGHCVRNGRVSGDWRVWACWIPARAATTSPASRLSRRPKRHLALAEVGFLCCIPIARAFCCPERPVSALRRSSRGCGAGWTSKHTLCPTSRARLHVLGLLAHGVVARSLGCGTHCGHEARGLCLPRKTSVLRFVRTTPVAVLGSSSHAGDGVGEECYLVDPASSHMLVSKIKPCMCKRLVRSGIRASVPPWGRGGVLDPKVLLRECRAKNLRARGERRRLASERAVEPEDENSRLRETVMNLEEKVSSLESEIAMLSSDLEDCRHVTQELASALGGSGVADMRREMEQMSIQIGLLQRAVSNGPAVAHDAGARLRIPEPKAYNGARDAKEVENFLFDIEQYFLAANVEDEARKVSTATMYLTGDAKLWWRTKYAEIQANQVRLDTWALLREAIREQFFPENVEYNARRALRKLEHSGSVRDYVKSFSALMLDIRDMSEKDKLFTFMEGLKPWARLELQRQRVTDLGSAMAAAERLTDFALETRKDRQTTSSPVQNKTGGARSFRSNSNRGGGDRKPYAQTGSQGSSVRNKPQENRQGAPQKSSGCFLCDGPHRYRDCPKKQLLNALATFTDKASPAKPVEPQASASGVNDSEEDEDNLGAISQWCNTLSHQVAAKKTVPPRAGKTAPL
ncbi:UNVERIFIED_CONTAM: hypothetical protein Slati_4562500 [Sesamum latifolium]|uniref:Retrotransposon gag domain-containing protein n=1 Tax=Sesamum latifolium TaxID=2727402 RepID=A0AAW2RP23_9LAMI